MGLHERDWYREALRHKKAKEDRARQVRQRSRVAHRSTGISKRSLIAPAFALIALSLLFQRYVADIPKPEVRIAADGASELLIRSDSQGHYRLQGQLNGQPVRFLVDTGATAVDIPERLQAQLKLKALGPVQTTTASDTFLSQRTLIDTIGIGPFALSNIEGELNPKAPNDEILLGMSALKKFEIVQKNNTLTLRLSDADRSFTVEPPPAARPETPPRIQFDRAAPDSLPPHPTAEPNLPKKRVKRSLRECMGPHNKIDRSTLACMEGY